MNPCPKHPKALNDGDCIDCLREEVFNLRARDPKVQAVIMGEQKKPKPRVCWKCGTDANVTPIRKYHSCQNFSCEMSRFGFKESVWNTSIHPNRIAAESQDPESVVCQAIEKIGIAESELILIVEYAEKDGTKACQVRAKECLKNIQEAFCLLTGKDGV